MPIRTQPINVLNAGAAIAQGNQNALSEINQANIGQQMQQRNALAPNVQAQSQIKTDADRTKLMVDTITTTTDQQQLNRL